MLVCNNCNTVNESNAVRCRHCNMAGNFSIKEKGQEALIIEKKGHSCKNCGSDHPGNGHKCMHCHFPIAENSREDQTGINSINPLHRKTG